MAESNLFIMYCLLTFIRVLHVLAQSDSNTSRCAWPDGTVADLVPCSPDAERTACCIQGETCLTSGLCYGTVGLPYRGACKGGWDDPSICPNVCNDLEGTKSSFANIWPCDGLGKTAPLKYWCGNGNAVPSLKRNAFYQMFQVRVHQQRHLEVQALFIRVRERLFPRTILDQTPDRAI
ncbi:hypothetical protein BDW75DRAFT_123496 [Aspergillus navahoensis]